jgi:hypothetical protein
MATVKGNAEAIVALAGGMDELVATFREKKAQIDALELAIRRQIGSTRTSPHSGRERLAHYAHSLMSKPLIVGDDLSVTAMATQAWSTYL